MDGEEGEDDAEESTGEREDDDFGEGALEKVGSGGSESGTDGGFTVAMNEAGELCIGEVDARDEQDAEDGGHKEPETRGGAADEGLETGIFVAFGGAALLLALLGIYGTLSYSVEVRTQEVGIRMALGATRESVYRLMLATIIAPVTIGLALGCIASLTIGKSLASLLYNTRPTDLTVILPVVCIFTIAARAATFVPCSRAAKIEPMEALRAE